jgi:hypothetical protein
MLEPVGNAKRAQQDITAKQKPLTAKVIPCVGLENTNIALVVDWNAYAVPQASSRRKRGIEIAG